MEGAITRRQFIARVAARGGSTHAAMLALGLLAAPAAAKTAPLTGTGAGRRVLVLGAGLAGMSAAYELTKLGYDVLVLEARARPGGRCVTVRRGFVEPELDEEPRAAAFPSSPLPPAPSPAAAGEGVQGVRARGVERRRCHLPPYRHLPGARHLWARAGIFARDPPGPPRTRRSPGGRGHRATASRRPTPAQLSPVRPPRPAGAAARG
jgi:hypothetical protein